MSVARLLLWAATLPLALFASFHSWTTFVDVTESSGITWRHWNGKSADHFLVESTTGGVGVLDFDNDGHQDIFLANGGNTPDGKSPGPVRCALYRNLGNGRFADVAEHAGIAALPFYGMGVSAADYDNDGFTDLYVTGYPRSALFHNNGNGTFIDVTASAGVRNEGAWGASAAWFDYDRDGLLDLFVTNYVQFSYSDHKQCLFGSEPTYCAQTEYQGSVSRLFHNNGKGSFTDVTEKAGLGTLAGRGLGVVAVDIDGDGWCDLFVARDASANLLLLNRRDGTFRESGLEKEIAYNADGVARSGMGVDVADLNRDGRPDFVVTNFDHEYHALYLSTPEGPYKEATVSSGLARYTRPYVGWGVKFLDYDHDGEPDLLIANGHLHEKIAQSNQEVQYREPILLLRNMGNARFERVTVEGIPAFESGILGRGLATADFNNDGLEDAIVMNLNDRPVLLRNSTRNTNGWLGIALQGTSGNRDAIGARVTLHAGEKSITKWVTGGGSVLSSSEKRLVFGLAPSSAGESASLEIRWPDGKNQTISQLKLSAYNPIVEP